MSAVPGIHEWLAQQRADENLSPAAAPGSIAAPKQPAAKKTAKQMQDELERREAAEAAAEAKLRDERDERRRRQQQETNELIQAEPIRTFPPFLSVDNMLADCVWITEGGQVGRLSEPKMALTFNEFSDLTACNTTEVPPEPDSKAKPRHVPNAVIWKKSPLRQTVMARTFRAGAGEICIDPDGKTSLNTWRPIKRRQSSASVQPFLDHVAYLFEDAGEREVFLHWLAHIEQCPGVLPHHGWLHIADNTGTGRNWLASVLARVWRGYVAPNVDLPMVLEGQFNGMLAGRVLAMVDEVQEGGGENPYRMSNKLNAIVNAETRDINPKFGRQYKEHNSCRWLVFSNYENALPIKGTDRRWRVVHHKAAPRSPDIYVKLYSLLEDAEFINAVGAWLGERDISSFNPGERPPMSEAKRAALAASKSQLQQSADQVVKNWPADVVTSRDVAALLGDAPEKGVTPAMRRALVEAGALQWEEGRVVKIRRQVVKCWILRNVDRWEGATAAEIAAEAVRALDAGGGGTALEILADASTRQDADECPF